MAVARGAGGGSASGGVSTGKTVQPADNRTLQANGVMKTNSVSSVKSGGLTASSGKGKSSGGKRKVTYINNGARAAGAAESTTPKVTPGTTPDYYVRMQKYYQKMYDEQVAANNAAAEKAGDQARQETEAQLAALGEQYKGTNRQLYRDYMNSRRTLPQELAARGYSGGLSESSMLRLSNAYEEGLNENERARLAQETSYNLSLARQLFDARAKADEANLQAGQQRYTNLAAIRQAMYKDQQQRAATMAAAGDFTEYARLGFSKSEIRYLREMWKRMNPDLA